MKAQEERCPDCGRRISDCICDDGFLEDGDERVPFSIRKFLKKKQLLVIVAIGIAIISFVIIFFISQTKSPIEPAFPVSTPQVQNMESEVLQLADRPEFFHQFSILTLGILVLVVLLFFEVYFRQERLMLDWWIVLLTIPVLSLREAIGWDLFLILITVVTVLNFIAVMFNNDGNGRSKFGVVDFSPIFTEAAILMTLYVENWPLPYPAYIPIQVVIVVMAATGAWEFLRTPLYSLLAVLLGVVMGFTLNPIIIFLGIILGLLLVNLNKAPSIYIKRRTNLVFSQGMRLEIPWDVLVAELTAFLLTCYFLYGNFTVFVLNFQ